MPALHSVQLWTEADDEAAAWIPRLHSPDEYRLELVDEVDELHVAAARQEDVGVVEIRLLDGPLGLDVEPKLTEVRAAVELGPEEPLDAPTLGKGREERPVPEDGRWSWVQPLHGGTFRHWATVSLTFCVPVVPYVSVS